ncbi:MAG: 2,3-bisphosphoglycerate-independent phosphoglycerate mutase [Gammaproteobacteria bacterium]|nr:2,3-bisphosphoglycerate-independent phosphoglycerate mutase [Gammaproteobacteria bacterium]MDH5728869.1 2,3-bisphosphoglycerate-independent phosphoglycerate mutase [Gammaproteobacteria bacterium]
MKLDQRPIVLIVMDGWGYSEDPENNAIAHAKTPFWDKIWKNYPHTLIRASESAVGLPNNQMGNSEVGHLNLGAGRVVYQEISRVSKALKNGTFQTNNTLLSAIETAKNTKKSIHIMGLLSDGGVHSHEEHIHAMVELAVSQGADKVYIHAFLDGRDTAPKSAEHSIRAMEACFERVGGGRFASIIGRYFAMDRDHRWPRIKSAYDLITHAEGEFQASSALDGLLAAYERGKTDEFVEATVIANDSQPAVKIEDGDVLFFMNFRSDRARQITRPFIEPDFEAFDRGHVPAIADFVSLTEYHEDFSASVAFPPERLRNVFGSYISDLGLRQLRIAETEKYAHVTFFLNGGVEEPFAGEDRTLIPSPDVATYDLQPEMNAPKLTEELLKAIQSDKYDVIICNYANPDMVGHTGNFDATVKAIETLDSCLEKVVSEVQAVGGELILTADHGNAELMLNQQSGQAHTAHTTNPVPFVYIGREAELAAIGALSDVTPSMLYLMGIEKPAEMGGQSLINLSESD